MIELKFSIIAEGNIYLIPKFVKCVHCGHEIPVGEILDNSINPEAISGFLIDRGGCQKSSSFTEYAKYFGVIKNVKE